MRKRRKLIITLIIIWFVFFITDFSLSVLKKPPVFALPLIRYRDGGSVQYFGLGYKVIKYVDMRDIGIEVLRYDIGTWFMRFSK